MISNAAIVTITVYAGSLAMTVTSFTYPIYSDQTSIGLHSVSPRNTFVSQQHTTTVEALKPPQQLPP
jgi:hypothetical protein